MRPERSLAFDLLNSGQSDLDCCRFRDAHLAKMAWRRATSGSDTPVLSVSRTIRGLSCAGQGRQVRLSLLARDSKAKRGELRFALPPGYCCWDKRGRIVMVADERVVETVHLVFRKFHELGSARQALIWARQHQIELPVIRRSLTTRCIVWRYPAYYKVLAMLQHPLYAQVPICLGTVRSTRRWSRDGLARAKDKKNHAGLEASCSAGIGVAMERRPGARRAA